MLWIAAWPTNRYSPWTPKAAAGWHSIATSGSSNVASGTPFQAAPTAPLPAEKPVETSMAQPTESVGTATRMKHAAQDAGSAVGGFARKSYKCVLALVSNCSEEAEN